MLIGEKVFELRKKRGLSQENLALDLGLSQSTISNYEIHSNFLDLPTIQKNAEYFNVPV